jgi:hypothetical protein
MILTLPFAALSQNTYTRKHRFAKAKLVKEYAQLIGSKIIASDFEDESLPRWHPVDGKRTRTSKPSCSLSKIVVAQHPDQLQPRKRTVIIRRYSAGELDPGNLVGGCKPLIDALVRVGLIYDDRSKWLDAKYEQHPAPARHGRTEIEIMEAGNNCLEVGDG